jgi:hypothetical protein
VCQAEDTARLKEDDSLSIRAVTAMLMGAVEALKKKGQHNAAHQRIKKDLLYLISDGRNHGHLGEKEVSEVLTMYSGRGNFIYTILALIYPLAIEKCL